jgi:O-antigen/teichoic acid export membrane protein
MRLASLVLILTFLYSFAQVSLQALGRFRPLLWSRLVFGTLVSASAVGAAAIFGDVRAVLAAQAAIALSSCVVVFIALGRAITARIRPAFHRPTFREMAGYGALVLGSGLAYQVMMHGPPTVLAGSAPSAEVAAFAVPAVVLQQLLLLVGAASTGFMPFASAESAAADRGRLSAVFRSHLRLTIAVIGPIAGFLVVFADPLLRAWVGADFASQAADPLRLLAATGLVLALAGPPGDISRGLGRAGWGLAHGIVAAGVGILVAVPAVERSGATGAALGLLIGVSVATPPFLYLVAHRFLGQPPSRLTIALAPPALAAAAATALYWAGSAIVAGFAGAVLTGAVVTALYALVVFRMVLDDLERSTLRAGMRTLAPLTKGLARLSRRRRMGAPRVG